MTGRGIAGFEAFTGGVVSAWFISGDLGLSDRGTVVSSAGVAGSAEIGFGFITGRAITGLAGVGFGAGNASSCFTSVVFTSEVFSDDDSSALTGLSDTGLGLITGRAITGLAVGFAGVGSPIGGVCSAADVLEAIDGEADGNFGFTTGRATTGLGFAISVSVFSFAIGISFGSGSFASTDFSTSGRATIACRYFLRSGFIR